jgi:hypothetical protein
MSLGKGTWIPEDQRDTRWYIFKKTWLCSVSSFEARTVEDIQHFGVPTSGDPLYDKAMQEERISTMMTIDQMAEYFKRGITVGVVKYADTKLIYEAISNHLQAWKQKLEDGWHTRNAPIEDLILLDKLAMAVYAHARHQFTTEMVDSILARRMAGALRVSRSQIMGNGPKVIEINKDPETGEETREEKLPERQSMAEVFANHAAIASGGAKYGAPLPSINTSGPAQPISREDAAYQQNLSRGGSKWR